MKVANVFTDVVVVVIIVVFQLIYIVSINWISLELISSKQIYLQSFRRTADFIVSALCS